MDVSELFDTVVQDLESPTVVENVIIRNINKNDETTLMKICKTKKKIDDVINLVINQCEYIDHQDCLGNTALIYACTYHSYHINNCVKILIDNNCNVNLQNNLGNTALMYACNAGCLPIVKMLIDVGANIDIANKNGETPLMYACHSKNFKLVRFLIHCGANINSVNNNKCNALFYCGRFSDKEHKALAMMADEIKSGTGLISDYSQRPFCGKRRKFDNSQIIFFLVKNGIDINAVDKTGKTVLMKMCEYSNIAGNRINIETLLDAGCDPNIVHNKPVNLKSMIKVSCRITALMYLIYSSNLELKKDTFLKLMYASQKSISYYSTIWSTSYNLYIEDGNSILNEDELKILKGDVQINSIKPIR